MALISIGRVTKVNGRSTPSLTSGNSLGLVPFSHQAGVTSLADIHMLFFAAEYCCPLVTDTTTTELDRGPDKLAVIQEAGKWDDPSRS